MRFPSTPDNQFRTDSGAVGLGSATCSEFPCRSVQLRWNSAGQCNLGFAYEYGRAVGKDLPEAMRWFRLSAEQGNSLAQGALGAIFADGIGGQPNYVEASKWFKMAADQDDPVAMEFFGEQNEKGWGVPQNIEEAIKWYRRAATAGSEDAKKNLARLGL